MEASAWIGPQVRWCVAESTAPSVRALPAHALTHMHACTCRTLHVRTHARPNLALLSCRKNPVATLGRGIGCHAPLGFARFLNVGLLLHQVTGPRVLDAAPYSWDGLGRGCPIAEVLTEHQEDEAPPGPTLIWSSFHWLR